MVKRAIALDGEIPNEHIPPEGSAERERLAAEFERGRKAALAELSQVGVMPPFDSSGHFITTSSYEMPPSVSYFASSFPLFPQNKTVK